MRSTVRRRWKRKGGLDLQIPRISCRSPAHMRSGPQLSVGATGIEQLHLYRKDGAVLYHFDSLVGLVH